MAPGTFRRVIDVILSHVKWTYAIVYLYYVIVFSKSVEEHFCSRPGIQPEIPAGITGWVKRGSVPEF